MAAGGAIPTWTRRGDCLVAAVAVHPSVQALAAERAVHQLRAWRARRRGVSHPTSVDWRDGLLSVRFGPGVLSGGRTVPVGNFAQWASRVAIPATDSMVHLHRLGFAGLAEAGLVGGCWLPPLSWFTGPLADAPLHIGVAGDRAALRRWLQDERARRGVPGRAADQDLLAALLDIVQGSLPVESAPLALAQARARWEGSDRTYAEAPSLLSLWTEAELLERLSSLQAFRVLPRDELVSFGLQDARHEVIEVDPSWRDPHFPAVAPLPIQEIWEELVGEQRVEVPLRLFTRAPNVLDRLGPPPPKEPPDPRWIGVHADQPLLFVRGLDRQHPRAGWLYPLSPGDDTLLQRKRRFTVFAGDHPATDGWIIDPPPATPFDQNTVSRDRLVDRILSSVGPFVVQGPPGTGKTHLATELVRRCLEAKPTARILVCAKEHFALGHIRIKICAALEAAGLPYRGYRSVSLAKLRRGGVEAQDIWLGRRAAADIGRREWRQDAAGWQAWQMTTVDDHDGRCDDLARAAASVFFCTTTDEAMMGFLDQASFDLVVVEEAGKCYPSELLHAVCLGRTTVLIGDHLQLPPYQEQRTRAAVTAWVDLVAKTVDPQFAESARARFPGLVASMMQVGAALQGEPSSDQRKILRTFEFLFDRTDQRYRLDEQFRMEASLSDLIGQVFYGRPFVHRKGELVEAGLLPPRPLGDALPDDLDTPLLWIDTPHTTQEPDAGEDQGREGLRDNQFELECILGYLRRLRSAEDLDLVILTPYRAQRKLLRESDALAEACRRLSRRPMTELVRTTDEYQGREAELTVLSLVRNNAQGARAWGFMAEPERLNVMFSRARFRQVVVGCGAHIDRHGQDVPFLASVWRAYQLSARSGEARVLRAREVRRG